MGGFRPALFQAAVDAGAPVVPLRLSYRSAATNSTTTAASFLGEETLLRSVRRVVAARGLEVRVTVAAALHPAGDADRRVLARAAESAVHLVPAPVVSAARRVAVPRPWGLRRRWVRTPWWRSFRWLPVSRTPCGRSRRAGGSTWPRSGIATCLVLSRCIALSFVPSGAPSACREGRTT